jgi:hypothetical protein
MLTFLKPSTLSLAMLMACGVALTACNNDTTKVEISLGDPVPTGDTIALTERGILISFNRTTPQTLVSVKGVLGLQPNDVLIGIDYRPADGKLYSIGKLGNVYVLDPATGGATFKVALKASAADTSLPYQGITGDAEQMALDFNPVADRLRVIGNDGQNLRINVDTGEVTTDGVINAPEPAVITSAAYSNSMAGTGNTNLYVIDVNRDRVYLQNPPNDGTLQNATSASLGLEATGTSGFDIDPVTNQGYAVLQIDSVSQFYRIDLSTIGTAFIASHVIGPLPSNAKNIRGIALKPTTATAYGLTANNQLTAFNVTTPNTIHALTMISGLLPDEKIVGMDFRINTLVSSKKGLLYGLSNMGNLYLIDPTTGIASGRLTLQAAPTDATAAYSTLVGSTFGVDFNPSVDRLRVVSNTGQNLRIDVDAGLVTTDTAINLINSTPQVTAIAYSNSFLDSTNTVLHDLEGITQSLYVQNPPNDGTLSLKGSTTLSLGLNNGFDIVGGENGLALITVAAATGPSTLYQIDLLTGAATPAVKISGTANAAASVIGNSTTPALIDLAVLLQ